MSYADSMKAAIAAKSAVNLMPAFFQFKDEGNAIVGRFISASSVESKKNPGTYKDYVFDTDDGHVHFACGAMFDSKVGASLVIGNIYSITFKGKRKIDGGRSVNEFDVLSIPDPMAR